MNEFADLVRVTTPTTGTGTVTLAAPVPGYLSFAQAGVPDGAIVSYGIADVFQSETGSGAYNSGAATLTRNVYRSTGAGNTAPINLSGAAQVFVTALSADFSSLNAPDDGAQYARVGDTWQVVELGTTVNSARYRFNTNTATPPASGNVRFNHTDASATTIVYVHEVNMDGTNLGNLFGLISSEARLFIQDKDTTTRYHVFDLTGVPVDAGDYFNFPVAYLRGAGGNFVASELLSVSVIGGGGSVPPLPPGTTYDQLVYVGGWSGQRARYITGCFVPSLLTASQYLLLHQFSKAVTFPANFGGFLGHVSEARGTTNATGSTVINIRKSLAASPGTFSNVGTVTVAAGSMFGTFASSGAVSFAQGDALALVAPASADATFANFAATLVGYET